MNLVYRFSLILGLFAMILVTLLAGQSTGSWQTYQVVHGWPVLPEGFGLGEVSGVGVDSHNHVFVFQRSRYPVRCFDGTTGKQIAAWGEGLFAAPHGMVVQDDKIWVTDHVGHQVFKFSHDGEILLRVGEKGVAGQDGEHFNGPTDIAVLPDGTFYVADGYGNSRIAKFAKNGWLVAEWGRRGSGPGEFHTPHSVAVDAQGKVYVADRENARIQVFNDDGKFLREWKSQELGRPWALRVGPDGYLYVVDGGDMKEQPPDRAGIVKMDLEGNIVARWGSYGTYDGQLHWPHDIAIGRDGAVYVGDVWLGMRIQKFVPR